MMGSERRTLVMSDDEKKLTAYHEAGHALIAIKQKASDPIHKATIIPRGRALGMVMRLPERDQLSMTREKLKADGLQKAVASNISAKSSFIIKHYNKKQVYYIQVGGAGLFYMGKNPLNLPVPELQGDINIELRVGYGGSGGKPTVSAGIRLQGRLRTENVSNFTLDDPGSIQALFMQ